MDGSVLRYPHFYRLKELFEPSLSVTVPGLRIVSLVASMMQQEKRPLSSVYYVVWRGDDGWESTVRAR